MPERVGGRAKGTPNHKTRKKREALEKAGCDPFAFLQRVMDGKNFPQTLFNEITQIWEVVKAPAPLRLRLDAAKELAPYLMPKMVAIKVEGQIKVTKSTPAEELAMERLAAIKTVEGKSEPIN